jgi:hypothetical protein
MKFQLFEGVQDVFSRPTAVCCILLPYNPYRLPHHYKRQVCEPSVAVNIDICGYLCILSITFV